MFQLKKKKREYVWTESMKETNVENVSELLRELVRDHNDFIY